MCCSDLFQGTDISYLHFSVDKQKRLFKKEVMDVNEVSRFTLGQCAFKGSHLEDTVHCARISFHYGNVIIQ
jgi:hypothetical protein